MQINSQVTQLINSGQRLLRRQVVLDLTGLSKATIWRLEKAGRFPKAIQLTPRTVGYRESDISAWLDSPEDYQNKCS